MSTTVYPATATFPANGAFPASAAFSASAAFPASGLRETFVVGLTGKTGVDLVVPGPSFAKCFTFTNTPNNDYIQCYFTIDGQGLDPGEADISVIIDTLTSASNAAAIVARMVTVFNLASGIGYTAAAVGESVVITSISTGPVIVPPIDVNTGLTIIVTQVGA